MKKEKLSSPREGISLASATEERAEYIRNAVEFLANGFDNIQLHRSFNSIFAPRWGLEFTCPNQPKDINYRAAWNLVCTWLMANAASEIDTRSNLKNGEEWFIGDSHLPVLPLSSIVSSDSMIKAHLELQKVPIDEDFWDLFPYILEQYGPGSRLAVFRNPKNYHSRIAKRHHGVFYTPADVADYMVRRVLANYSGEAARSKCLDPASGTGVFLLAMCRGVGERASADIDRFQYVTQNLYGCDISAQAVEACAFVLLHHCLPDIGKHRISPWAAWHIIRLNLATMDSLLLAPPGFHIESDCAIRTTLREEKKQELFEGGAWVEPLKTLHIEKHSSQLFPESGLIKISELFPEASAGFNILIGNPPYSKLDKRHDFPSLAAEYACLSRSNSGDNQDTFLLFVEMMFRVTVPGHNSSAMVTPLSIAYNSGVQYRDCRRALSEQGGKLQFAFFDREPHALFGEEVKTRNAILFRVEDDLAPSRGRSALIETGSLRKWTSRTRKQLFSSIKFTPIGTIDLTHRIPMLEGGSQAIAYIGIRSGMHTFQNFCKKISRCRLQNILLPKQSKRVFVGGTAYNFLNVFRSFSVDDGSENPLSESPVHCLEFDSEENANIAFAILSSRFVFWLWRIEADGFHVPGWFIRTIPFARDSFSHEQLKHLSEAGTHLWKAVKATRFSCLNGGKLTYTFHPLAFNEERDLIDSILSGAAGLPCDFVRELRDFVRTIVIVDENDYRRNHLQKYFTEASNPCLER